MAKVKVKIVLKDVQRAPVTVLGALLQKGIGLEWEAKQQAGQAGSTEIVAEFDRSDLNGLFAKVVVMAPRGTKFTIHVLSGDKEWWPRGESKATTGGTILFRNAEFLEVQVP
jgi:hypothetical protein